MTTWNQSGFVVISDTDLNAPLVHIFDVSQWSCDYYVRTHHDMPEYLRRNMRALPATLTFSDDLAITPG